MARQVPVAAVVNSLDLLPTEWKVIFDIHRVVAVVSQFVRLVRPCAQRRGRDEFYTDYSLYVTECTRENHFQR